MKLKHSLFVMHQFIENLERHYTFNETPRDWASIQYRCVEPCSSRCQDLMKNIDRGGHVQIRLPGRLDSNHPRDSSDVLAPCFKLGVVLSLVQGSRSG